MSVKNTRKPFTVSSTKAAILGTSHIKRKLDAYVVGCTSGSKEVPGERNV
jgi:hypothetical protein